ncbi:MAG: hypothetical protein C0593_01405 [Marinilabiliales bacterium]|nr:MAG: hypothetical protein C0593_01405 [Marinilabiliales bacterium]
MEIFIPGSQALHISHLVFDFNGTLACNGKLLDGVEERLNRLSDNYNIHIITADTFGTVQQQMENICCELVVIPQKNQDQAKAEFIKALTPSTCISFGNGANDILMLQNSALGITIMGCEGAATKTLLASDIVINNITDALDLLIYPDRLKATLRQ